MITINYQTSLISNKCFFARIISVLQIRKSSIKYKCLSDRKKQRVHLINNTIQKLVVDSDRAKYGKKWSWFTRCSWAQKHTQWTLFRWRRHLFSRREQPACIEFLKNRNKRIWFLNKKIFGVIDGAIGRI